MDLFVTSKTSSLQCFSVLCFDLVERDIKVGSFLCFQITHLPRVNVHKRFRAKIKNARAGKAKLNEGEVGGKSYKLA